MTAQHWDNVFRSVALRQVSWYQHTHTISLALIADTPGSVIDVGAGDSTLVDELLGLGRTDVTVLDVSSEALDLTRRRLAHRAKEVRFEVADITTWHARRRYQVWHDRAVFHFLTQAADQSAYIELATRTVSPGGALVLATFAADGPTHCSGLPTARYTTAELADMFRLAFDLENCTRETHHTPIGAAQSFSWVKLRRR